MTPIYIFLTALTILIIVNIILTLKAGRNEASIDLTITKIIEA
jgi:hypothetical protein